MAKILEQELLRFLNNNGYYAGPEAPVSPSDIPYDEYVTVSRLGADSDIRYEYDDTTVVVDCFIKDPQTTGRDRYDAAKIAKQVIKDIKAFVKQSGWVRKIIGTPTLSDTSDDRFTSYSVIVTFKHNS